MLLRTRQLAGRNGASIRTTLQKRWFGASSSVAAPDSILSQLRPMTEPLEGLPEPRPARELPVPETRISTLPNGVRVVSEEDYGQTSSIGVFVDAGSRFETGATRGVTHLLERLAYTSTTRMTGPEVHSAFSNIGGDLRVAGARDQVMWMTTCLREHAKTATQLVADSAFRPALGADDMELAKMDALQTYDFLWSDPEKVAPELLHEAAFGPDSALGQAQVPTPDVLGQLTADSVRAHMAACFAGPRVVVAGAGVEHEEFVSWAADAFADVPAQSSLPVPAGTSAYRPRELVRPMDAIEDVHVSIGFHVNGWGHDDAVPLCVLHTLLGGGLSFSPGGPGKGLYTRLYRDVLQTYGWVNSVLSMAYLVNDQGLLAINASGPARFADDLTRVCASHLLEIAMSPVPTPEFERARHMLRASVLMNLEHQQILCEDLGRQVLMYGQRHDAKTLCERIEACTAQDLQRIVAQYAQAPPSVAVFGQTKEYSGLSKLFARKA